MLQSRATFIKFCLKAFDIICQPRAAFNSGGDLVFDPIELLVRLGKFFGVVDTPSLFDNSLTTIEDCRAILNHVGKKFVVEGVGRQKILGVFYERVDLRTHFINGTRTALGVGALRKDYADISRGYMGRESRYLGHKDVGMASWYGAQFHGKRSSDGSRYNKEEYTAAHRVYPFGTLVKVTNMKNSKSCVVKITDRGPYFHGRIIDLSKKAAEDLGMLGSGVAKVKIEVVGQY